jgi:hypothetical protein
VNDNWIENQLTESQRRSYGVAVGDQVVTGPPGDQRIGRVVAVRCRSDKDAKFLSLSQRIEIYVDWGST